MVKDSEKYRIYYQCGLVNEMILKMIEKSLNKLITQYSNLQGNFQS